MVRVLVNWWAYTRGAYIRGGLIFGGLRYSTTPTVFVLFSRCLSVAR